MQRNILSVLSMGLAAGLVAALPAAGPAGAADTVKIGFNAPLTGFAAADGKSALTGAELAVEQANAAGGIDGKMVELVVYDDQASPKEVVPIATKLINQDEVKIAISGSYSGATRAAAGVFQTAGVPYISAYAVHPGHHPGRGLRLPYILRRRGPGPRRGQADRRSPWTSPRRSRSSP